MRSLEFSEITNLSGQNVNIMVCPNKDSLPRDLYIMTFVNCPLGKGVKLTAAGSK